MFVLVILSLAYNTFTPGQQPSGNDFVGCLGVFCKSVFFQGEEEGNKARRGTHRPISLGFAWGFGERFR